MIKDAKKKYNDDVSRADAYEFIPYDLNLDNNRKVTIAIIDDNGEDVKHFQELLRTDGNVNFSMKVWHKLTDALKFFQNTDNKHDSLDVIVLDFSMNEINCISMIDKLRQIDVIKNTPIVIYSSNDNMDVIKTLQKHDATAFFKKPLNITEFLNFLGI